MRSASQDDVDVTWIGECDESESSGSAAFTVFHYYAVDDFAEATEISL